jgi:protoporphyrin/coproporphyrin ferrochelatase
MKAAVLLIGFGEPESAAPESVAPFLERIFLANARLDPVADPTQARERARAMAERRLPDLVADYVRIGGSPLNAQTAAQADELAAELERRGHDVVVLVGMQFTDPTVASAVERAAGAGAGRLIAIPLYPICGPSTTILALDAVGESLAALSWSRPVAEITGWHAHPLYTALRADGVRRFCAGRGLDLSDPATGLVFSAHGTPVQYLREGSRYDVYVEDHCRRLAAELGVERYVLGYQNHANRPGVPWTGPEIEPVVTGVDAARVVVVPISFMQEQSETLAELDHTLAGAAGAAGLEFHRVPVPHADPRFTALLAELVGQVLAGDPDQGGLGPCRCRPRPGTVCLNRELTPAPR